MKLLNYSCIKAKKCNKNGNKFSRKIKMHRLINSSSEKHKI